MTRPCGPTVVVVPVYRRPHRVGPFLASLAAATPEPHRVLFMASDDDEDELAELRQRGATFASIPWAPGDFARKVNHAFTITTEPFVFVCGDDVAFHYGWLGAAIKVMNRNPDVGVVGTQDMGNDRVLAREHATHWLIRRTYIDTIGGTIDAGPGVALHPGYWHNFVDDELVGVAKSRGAWAFANDSIVEHLHPMWGKARTDPTYNLARRRFNDDRVRFRQREVMWTLQP